VSFDVSERYFEGAEVAADSWLPRNLAGLGDRPQVQPTLGGIGLLYPGKRHAFTGPQESGKTMAAYAAVLGVVRESGAVVLFDFEMTDYDARDRLREMGATADELERILYVRPTSAPTQERIHALARREPSLIVIDAAAGAFNLAGLDDNRRGDVEAFHTTWLRPFEECGSASLILDHVVKNVEGRGKYAIGSERKVGGVDVHLGFEVVRELRRGEYGRVKIHTHKDRIGWLPRPRAADFELRSDPETHAITWTFAPASAEQETADGGFRPTGLMERASRALEAVEPMTKTALAECFQGRREWKLRAIDCLLAEGFATTLDDGRIASAEPYREGAASSRPENDAQVPGVPSVPSGSRTGSQLTGEGGSSQVPTPYGGEPGTTPRDEVPA
jgi:hypothetical protein